MFLIVENGIVTNYSDMKINSGKGVLIEIDLTEDDKIKLDKGYGFNIDSLEFIENENSLKIEKQNLFKKYKSNLEQIKNINSEIDEINQTSEYFPELANKRITKLESDRTNLRSENGKILSTAVDRFGEDIINEF